MIDSNSICNIVPLWEKYTLTIQDSAEYPYILRERV